MEQSKEYSLEKEQATDPAGESSDEHENTPPSEMGPEPADQEEVEGPDTEAQDDDSEPPISGAPEDPEDPEYIDLDDLPVLTESIPSEVVTGLTDGAVSGAGQIPGVVPSLTLSRANLEQIAGAILGLIDHQISYANLPLETSTDHEALKRAIADHLEHHLLDS